MPEKRDYQSAFNAGELSPRLVGRGDLRAYQQGLAICENWQILRQGGLDRRTGSLFLHAQRDTTKKARLIRFEPSSTSSFNIQFENQYARILTNRGIVIHATLTTEGLDTTTEEVLVANHGLIDDAGPFRAVDTGGGLPADMDAVTDYYVDMLPYWPGLNIESADAGTELFTSTAHGLVDEMGPYHLIPGLAGGIPRGTITGSWVDELTDVRDLYIDNALANTFSLDETAPATNALNLTDVTNILPLYLKADREQHTGRFRLRKGSTTGTIVVFGGGDPTVFDLVPTGVQPIEFEHPYSDLELPDLRYSQIADFMYLNHPNHPPRKLIRISNRQWLVEDYDTADGPWLSLQEEAPNVVHPTVTITPSLDTSTGDRCILTASAALFTANDVGRLVRWYLDTAPLKKRGWAKIIRFHSSTVVDARVGSDFNLPLAASLDWRLGAWGDRLSLGWPRAVTFNEQRLGHGGTIAEPQTFWLSQVADFENQAPDTEDSNGDFIVTDSSAIAFSIVAEEVGTIEWMAPQRALTIGTTSGVWLVQATTQNEAITPTNINARRQSQIGSSNLRPVVLADSILFSSSCRRCLRAARFDGEQDAVIPTDLMLLADHLGESGTIEQIVDVGSPTYLVLAVRSDGQILALTYDAVQQVQAWARWKLGASIADDTVVESVSSASTAGSTEDADIYITVKRTIDGVVRRDVEVFSVRFGLEALIENAHFVDAGIDATDTAKTVWPNLDHLEGETVQVLADGARQPDVVVSGGSVTIQDAAAHVHIGLPYISKAKTMPVEIAASSTQGFIAMTRKKLSRAFLRFLRTGALKIGPTEARAREIAFRDLETDLMDTAVALKTGVLEIPAATGYDREGQLVFLVDGPLPAQVLTLATRVEWSER